MKFSWLIALSFGQEKSWNRKKIMEWNGKKKSLAPVAVMAEDCLILILVEYSHVVRWKVLCRCGSQQTLQIEINLKCLFPLSQVISLLELTVLPQGLLLWGCLLCGCEKLIYHQDVCFYPVIWAHLTSHSSQHPDGQGNDSAIWLTLHWLSVLHEKWKYTGHNTPIAQHSVSYNQL